MEGRGVTIFNYGAHTPTLAALEQNLTAALHWIQTAGNDNDIYVYRDNSPGHPLCSNRPHPAKWKPIDPPLKIVPYKNYSMWRRESGVYDSDSPVNWHKMEDMNARARALVRQHNRDNNHAHHVVYYLNVFNSTILPRDGHIFRRDCLHYFHPGPLDWWVHFWFTAMKHVADWEETWGR